MILTHLNNVLECVERDGIGQLDLDVLGFCAGLFVGVNNFLMHILDLAGDQVFHAGIVVAVLFRGLHVVLQAREELVVVDVHALGAGGQQAIQERLDRWQLGF